MTLDTNFFRKVMGQFATGVTIATTYGQAGLAGLTVNSFSSVSLRPPLVMICVDLRSHALPFFRESGVFAVNILSQEQEALSNCFAAHSEERYKHFCHASYHLAATGAPILKGTLGFVDARITAEYPGGDHAIFLGQVEALGYEDLIVLASEENDVQSASSRETSLASNNGHSREGNAHREPLLYYLGQYHRLVSHYHHAHPEETPAQKNHE